MNQRQGLKSAFEAPNLRQSPEKKQDVRVRLGASFPDIAAFSGPRAEWMCAGAFCGVKDLMNSINENYTDKLRRRSTVPAEVPGSLPLRHSSSSFQCT